MRFCRKLSCALGAIAVVTMLGGGLALRVAPKAFAVEAPNATKAAKEAQAARVALAKHKVTKAVSSAENAVSNDPNNAEYRALLGQAYLMAGRFGSAVAALTDALALNPEEGRVALNLALAKIATGDWQGARTTLQRHADLIPASDRGLAVALAGDPVAGVDILMPAARSATATAKTRQNLALALALAGRWQEARALAELDVAPDQLGQRIAEWAEFARPTNAHDQVATLLGVRAAEDIGQPSRLALSQQPRFAIAQAQNLSMVTAAVDPLDAYMPGPPPTEADGTVQPVTEVARAAMVSPPQGSVAMASVSSIIFAPRQAIVQQTAKGVPIGLAGEKPGGAMREGRAEAMLRAKANGGRFYVQLGAFANARVAQDAWRRTVARLPLLGGNVPHGAPVKTSIGSFYRLSVGGFARADADRLCSRVRLSGGTCFVRGAAGDAVARWVKPGGSTQQIASR